MWNEVANKFTSNNCTIRSELPSFSAMLNRQRELRLFKSPESTCKVIRLRCLFMKCLDFLWSETAFGITIEMEFSTCLLQLDFINSICLLCRQAGGFCQLHQNYNKILHLWCVAWIANACKAAKQIIRWQNLCPKPGFKFSFWIEKFFEWTWSNGWLMRRIRISFLSRRFLITIKRGSLTYDINRRIRLISVGSR